MAKSFISLIRVSTSRQGHSGLGLEAQREAVRQYVESAGGQLLVEHIEIESGKSGNRPTLHLAIAQCRERKATLLIAKLDRLARNVAFVSKLMEGRVDFIALDAPFANRLMLHLLAAFGEHEREMISARTRSALAAAKARGTILGRNGAVLAQQNRAKAANFAENMRLPIENCLRSGTPTLAEIAGKLNADGHTTPEGAKWGPTSVQRVLKRLNLRSAHMSGQVATAVPAA